MASTPTNSGNAFTIANFRRAFSQSPARQYMSDMDVEQVRKAVEEKDLMLLGSLYEILLREQVNSEDIVRDFVMTKNKILDGFMIETVNIEKKIVQGPKKAAAAKVERRERNRAEDILKKL